MKGIIESLIERRTGFRGRDGMAADPMVEISLEKTGRVRDYTPDSNEEYALTAYFRVLFWANQAQRSGARVIAERTLRHQLFAPLLAELSEAESAASDGDRIRVLEAVSRLRKQIIGE